ncbi:MAG: amino acid ABC transporter permease [Chloroflexota bacterium]
MDRHDFVSEQLQFIVTNLPHLLLGYPNQRPGGLLLSLLMAVVAIGLGFVLGGIVGNVYTSRWRVLQWFCRIYVELLRGLPLLLLLLIVYQVVGGRRFGLNLSPLAAAMISLTLYSSAYQAEIIRAGLQSVPEDLRESARVLGSSPWQTYWLIRLRYALRVMLPALVGQAISLFKDTSVVLIIGVADIMMVARIALGSDVTNAPHWVPLYMTVGFLYFCVAFSLSQLARRWEKRLEIKQLVHSVDNYV